MEPGKIKSWRVRTLLVQVFRFSRRGDFAPTIMMDDAARTPQQDEDDDELQRALIASLCGEPMTDEAHVPQPPPSTRFPGQLSDAGDATGLFATAGQEMDDHDRRGANDGGYSDDEADRILKRIRREEDVRLRQEQDDEYQAAMARDRARQPPTTIPPALPDDAPHTLMLKFRLPDGRHLCWRFHRTAAIEDVQTVAAYHIQRPMSAMQLFVHGRGQKYKPLVASDGTLDAIHIEDRELVLVRLLEDEQAGSAAFHS